MKKLIHLAVVGTLLGLGGCAPTRSQTDLQAEILRVDGEWMKAVQARDVDRAVSYWAEDAIVFPPGSPAVSGRAAIREYVEKSFQTPGFSVSWKTGERGGVERRRHGLHDRQQPRDLQHARRQAGRRGRESRFDLAPAEGRRMEVHRRHLERHGAFAVDAAWPSWPRVADLMAGDPAVRQVIEVSMEHERQVERQETEWLAKQKQ